LCLEPYKKSLLKEAYHSDKANGLSKHWFCVTYYDVQSFCGIKKLRLCPNKTNVDCYIKLNKDKEAGAAFMK